MDALKRFAADSSGLQASPTRGQASADSRARAARDALALAALALVVNLVRLGSKSIVQDEAVSVLHARSSPSSLLHAITGVDPNQSLYYILLSLWVRVFGESEAAVRFPSALFGALAVGATYELGRRLFGRAAGLLAGLLFALNPFMLQYAQTARAYALLVLLVTLSSFALAREIERPSKANRIAYWGTSVLSVYAHYFAVYVLTAHLLVVGTVRRRSVPLREALGVAAAILLACIPAVIFAYRGGAGHGINWIEPPALHDIVRVFANFAGGSPVLLCALLVAGCYGTALALREGRLWPYGFVAAWLHVPIALSFVVSLAKPMFLPYYLILCLPALILFGAAGIARIRPPVIAVALAALLVWICVTRLVGFYERDAPENWRAAARHVLDSSSSHDGFVFFPSWAATPFGYYARRNGVPEPANLEAGAPAAQERIWLVIRGSDAAADRSRFERVQSPLRDDFRLAEERWFGEIGIELYAR